VIVKRFKAVDL